MLLALPKTATLSDYHRMYPPLVQHPDIVLQDRPSGDGAVPGGRERRAADEHTQGQDLR